MKITTGMIVKAAAITLITMTILATSLPVYAASTKDEIKALSAQVEAMQKDLTEIKAMLKAGAGVAKPSGVTAFKEQTISIGESPYKGAIDATVTLIEYSDYQCPYCARNYRDVMPALVAEYVDTGKLKFVMRENPIPSLHRNAMNASLAALCAGDQGKYWEMHDIMFDNQKTLDVANLRDYAGKIGTNVTEFNDCLNSKKHEKRIAEDIRSGTNMGVSGTPGFVLGLTDSNDPDKAMLTVYIKGAQPLASFKQAIDGLLAEAE